MPTRCRCRSFAGVLALASLLTGTIALAAQPPEPAKNGKAKDAKDAKPQVVKLPDGTFLWLGGTAEGERVTLTPQEFQKLLDRVDSLKKELAARKPSAPSACAIRAKVEKRGEQLVAALKLTYTFRTAQANTAIALGGRRAFLVAAALDNAKLPVLDTGDDGFAVLVEAAGDHTLILDVEAPVTARGAKAEVGFDFGLPKAPITTLALDPPAGDVKRVNLTTRTPDATQPTKADTRRLTNIDLKQFRAQDGHAGLPLGPVEAVEVTWDPPASTAQASDQVQNAEFDVAVAFIDGYLESTAKVKLRGPALHWKFVAPASAEVSVERVAGDTGSQQPTVTKPTDSAKLIWKIELPAGSSAADWTITAVVRQPRPKSGAKSQALPVGPFAMLDVLRQTGTVKVTAGPHTRFVFKHGPDLRRAEPPGAPEEDNSVAFFRFTTGPTGTNAVNTPLLSVEAWPVEGTVRIKPTYKLKLTDAGWHIRAEIAVKPIRTEIDTVTIEVPAEWRGLESESDSEIVENVLQGKVEGAWRPVTVKLTNLFKKPVDVVLVGTVPVTPAPLGVPGAREAVVPLPRFPKAAEREASVLASVPDGWEVRGTVRGWDGDQPAAWSSPLAAVPGADGKLPKAIMNVAGKGEVGLSRVALNWQPYRPDMNADVRTEITIGERQVSVSQVIKLRSPDGFPKPVRLRGPAEAMGVKATPALDSSAAGVWSFQPPTELKNAELRLNYALPLAENGALPLGLFWPADAARTEMNVRVWVSSVTGRTVSTSSAGWRELPPELVPERDTLPALTLAASAEHTLTLDVRRSTAESAATLQLSRALIEAGMRDDGSVAYRARFRIQLSLTPVVEVILPDSVGPNPTSSVDGVKAALEPVQLGDGVKRFHVKLPEGRASVLELNYTLPGTRHVFGDTVYQPPLLLSASYLGGTRWLIAEPTDAAPLLFSNRGRADLRWRQRGITYSPTATNRAALEKWFTNGVEPTAADTATGAEGEPIALRQNSPEPVSVFRVPWLALVIGCSLVVFLVLIALTWLPAVASALMVVILGAAFVVGVMLFPQPAAQLVAAGQPGLLAGLLAIAMLAVIRWQVRRRISHLPGFTRTPTEPSATGAGLPQSTMSGSPSARSRPGSSMTGAPTPSGT